MRREGSEGGREKEIRKETKIAKGELSVDRCSDNMFYSTGPAVKSPDEMQQRAGRRRPSDSRVDQCQISAIRQISSHTHNEGEDKSVCGGSSFWPSHQCRG